MRWAASVGAAVAAWIGPDVMRWILGVLFLVMAGWCLIPDKEDEGPKNVGKLGAFLATAVAFFLVEMGDKTQLATVALAARFHDVVTVTAGTTAACCWRMCRPFCLAMC
ncbi:MAG: TMEM165/GDT1 family protein [Hyphomicrobium sp.]